MAYILIPHVKLVLVFLAFAVIVQSPSIITAGSKDFIDLIPGTVELLQRCE
jgi:hypothetical protein